MSFNLYKIIGVIICTVVIFCFNARAKSNDQSKIFDSLYAKAQSYKDLIMGEIKMPDGEVPLLIPVIKLKYRGDNGNNFILIDSLYEVVAIYKKHKKVHIINPENLQIALKGFTTNRILNLITPDIDAQKIFFCFFFDVDRYGLDLLGELKDDRLTIRGNDFKTATNLIATLINRFGSIKNYEKYAYNVSMQKYVLDRANEQYYFSVTDNWQFYAAYNKTDTLRNISLLIKDIKTSTLISGKKLKKLETSILSQLRDSSSFKINFDAELYKNIRYNVLTVIPFMKKDIYDILRAGLGDELFKKFIVQVKIGNKISSSMDGSFSTRFKGDRNDIKNFVNTNIIILNEKPFSYTIKNELKNPAVFVR